MSQEGSRILIIDDDESFLSALQRDVALAGYSVHVALDGEQGLKAARENPFDVVISDLKMAGLDGFDVASELRKSQPHLPVILMSGFGSTDVAITASKLGAFDYLFKPFDSQDLLALIQRALADAQNPEESVDMARPVEVERGIIGRSAAMQAVFKEIGRLAPSKIPVLIRGETGTGKELVARALHQHSDRHDQAFVAVNCLAIPETLLESELFGHERGAFTGATTQRIGRFEEANRGTLVLDEIGDLSLSLQGKLLRVLQEKCLQRVGGKESVHLDVRIVAATNRDLLHAIQEKQFREDLYYRLCGGIITLPPLRERRDDIIRLANHFLQRYQADTGLMPASISFGALQLLEEQDWPGNVRELENVMWRSFLRSRGRIITREIIRDALDASVAGMKGNRSASDPDDLVLHNLVTRLLESAEVDGKEGVYAEFIEQLERELYTRAFERTNGNQARLAKWLGVSRPTVNERLRRFLLTE